MPGMPGILPIYENILLQIEGDIRSAPGRRTKKALYRSSIWACVHLVDKIDISWISKKKLMILHKSIAIMIGAFVHNQYISLHYMY
jgi:hypothetical protein